MNPQRLPRSILLVLGVLAAGVASIGLSACGTSDITAPRLERSLSQTFSNLYLQQAKILGRRGITVASLKARAHCEKGGPTVADQGPGADWTCLMSWDDPNVPLPDGSGKFELNVHSNDCYTATGTAKLVGLLEITDTRGETVRNPLFEFDCCFDPNSSNNKRAAPTDPAVLKLPTGKLTPDSHGLVAPTFTCTHGAAGGCGGFLTATIGEHTIGRVIYQIAPGSENTYTFTLSGTESANGGKLTLTFAPLIGTVSSNPATLGLSPG